MATRSTFEELLVEVEEIGEKYEEMVRKADELGVLFAQVVSLDELYSVREVLGEIIYKADNLLDNKLEHDEVVSDAQDILNEVDSTFYTRRFISER